MTRIVVVDEAERQLVELHEWWLENREKAPGLVAEEFARCVMLLENTPGVGASFFEQASWRAPPADEEDAARALLHPRRRERDRLHHRDLGWPEGLRSDAPRPALTSVSLLRSSTAQSRRLYLLSL